MNARRRRRLMPAQSRSSRRGVLLLVVLSMLVLFMLMGTAFLMSSSQTKKSMQEAAKQDQNGNYATELLNRAMLQLVRDTDNPNSVIHYHSLLRDLYGTDGFQGVIQVPGALDFTKPEGQVTRYAGAVKDDTSTAAVREDLGPTNGQFIDIYVTQQAYIANSQKSLAHVLKLDRDPYGQSQIYTLPLTKGYFNGSLLTITNGPAAGQSARILDYENIGPTTTTPVSGVFRFRVMAFQRSDRQPLQIDSVTKTKSRNPELTDLAGASFIVNGRAFGGTGVGYNPLAATGQPRLSALQLFKTSATEGIGAELALLPNSAYFNPLVNAVVSAPTPGTDPFMASAPISTFGILNDPTAATPFFRYGNYLGMGGPNEGYDAADFQNMFLALQTVTPRSQGRVIHGPAATPLEVTDPLVLTQSTNFLRLDLENVPLPSFHRPDLVNFWNHRLLNYFVTAGMSPDAAVQAIVQPYSDDKFTPTSGVSPQNAALISAIKRQAILRPTREDHPHFDGSNPMSLPPTLTGVTPLAKSGNFMIPTWETVGPWDVDNDNDGVRDSVWVDLGDPIQQTEDGRRYKPLYAILCIDLDSRLNVNAHGLADDLVPPVLDTTKANYFDLTKSTGWVGNLSHDLTTVGPTTIYSTLQLARGLGYGPAEISLRPLFPAPLDTTPMYKYGNRAETITPGMNPIDSYATLLMGRQNLNGEVVSGRLGFDPNMSYPALATGDAATSGPNYRPDPVVRTPNWKTTPSPDAQMWYTGETSQPSVAAQIKFFDYPWSVVQSRTNQSSFSMPPDLKGRYALGVDWTGQPVYEVANDINPNNAQMYFNLLAKSPYEMDLTSAQRRDTWASRTNSFDSMGSDRATAFNTSLVQNDDAPFSPTDLEKILRGWDADSGALPSRLWDVVDAFDPVKLLTFDPNRIQSLASTSFGSTGNPALLAAAQQIAGINRRLATTDSFDLPVINQAMPGYVSDGGPDGVPGRRGVANQTLNAVDTDDFQNITGVSRAQAKIPDLLRYRVWIEARRFEMRRQGLTESSLDPANMSAAAYKTFLSTVVARVNAVFARSPQLLSDLLAPEVIAGKRMDLNRPFGDGRDSPHPFTGILDGVVDDPMEAGDPYLDVNGNGKWDSGEPFINLDGSVDGSSRPTYTPPYDRLWVQFWPAPVGSGLLAEPIVFDYSNGHAEPLPIDGNNSLLTYMSPVAGGIRNLDSQGRQLFARHLYCMTLLLMDDNFIAPWEEIAKDVPEPQLKVWMDAETKKLTTTYPSLNLGEVDLIVKRKLTCKMIAQWAVNCVDMRDADEIMTPLEYDENPWDGWGVWNDNWATDPTKVGAAGVFKDPSAAFKPAFIPLDGDSATNENIGVVIDWKNVGIAPNPNTKKVITLPTANVPTNALNQTRGLVWGAERPELLITETVAFHDRRTEDLMSPDTNGHDNFQNSRTTTPGNTRYKDYDMDQSLRPRGSLFVELHNPNSADGQLSSDIYSKFDSSSATNNTTSVTPSQGVELGRVSNYAVDAAGNLSTAASSDTIRRSPVWRFIVVEEDPLYRNREFDTIEDWNKPSDSAPAVKRDARPVDPFAGGLNAQRWNVPTASQASAQAAYTAAATAVRNWRPKALNPALDANPLPPFRPTNPDFADTFDFNFRPTQYNNANLFDVKYPYIEREFYFTSDNSKSWNVNSATDFKLRIPDRAFRSGQPVPNQHPNWPGYWQTQKFIAKDPTDTTGLRDQPIAPILPGRYGLVGSAGAKYKKKWDDAAAPASGIDKYFVTTIGRNEDGDLPNTADGAHQPLETRRIELRPDPNPNLNQLLVTANGGYDATSATPANYHERVAKQLKRSNELLVDPTNSSKLINILDRNKVGDANYNATKTIYQPCVAVPVDGMSASEPPWGWSPREAEAALEESARRSQPGRILGFDPTRANGEGRYFAPAGDAQSYDVPFDTAPELVRTGTTANYRTIHLQRLANPTLPWNPPPGQIYDSSDTAATHAAHDMHKPNLPINPYCTVDTSSVDLTAYNGVSRAEGTYPDKPSGDTGKITQARLNQFRPWVTTEGFQSPEAQSFVSNMHERGTQVFQFKTLERGAYSQLSTTHLIRDYTNSANLNDRLVPLPQRVLQAQEPVVGWVGDLNPNPDPTYPKGILKIRDGRNVSLLAGEMADSITGRSKPVIQQTIKVNRVDMVLEHSLGFGNEAYGQLYDQQSGSPTPAAYGAPRDYTVDDEKYTTSPTTSAHAVHSTYPWLTWDNRPFISAEEILKVPMASSAMLLRQFATVDPNVAIANRINPYGLSSLGYKQNVTLPTNGVRWAVMQAPYGGMANAFASTVDQLAAAFVPSVADVVRDPTTLAPKPDAKGHVQPYGAPSLSRVLEYVQVPSRFVGTETVLQAETFNDDPTVTNPPGNPLEDITALDPRFNFQPPFNKVSRERDPGRVNLNTVTGQRLAPQAAPGDTTPHIWSGVFDGIMHRYEVTDPLYPTRRYGDMDGPTQRGHFGPAWRDVVLSRRGYVQVDALGNAIDKVGLTPDTYEFGLRNNFPTFFANPFRSPDAGDLVPVAQMVQLGADASLERVHPRTRGTTTNLSGTVVFDKWGDSAAQKFGDSRDAGFGNDGVSFRADGAIPNSDIAQRDSLPLFSESRGDSFADTDRNPYMAYQPMSRLGNLVTNRSGVYAVWITVGYFEVEKAPDWNDPKVQDHFINSPTRTPADIAAGLALYNRAYPDGYMLGKELGSETGDVKRPRGFYIIDRTEEVGFKPGEDLNVEKAIRLRRRIE